MVVHYGGARIAVEVDGPSHFTANRPHARLGSTALRDRLLRAKGFAVAPVPFYEWNELGGDEDARGRYLRELVERAAAEAAAEARAAAAAAAKAAAAATPTKRGAGR